MIMKDFFKHITRDRNNALLFLVTFFAIPAAFIYTYLQPDNPTGDVVVRGVLIALFCIYNVAQIINYRNKKKL